MGYTLSIVKYSVKRDLISVKRDLFYTYIGGQMGYTLSNVAGVPKLHGGPSGTWADPEQLFSDQQQVLFCFVY